MRGILNFSILISRVWILEDRACHCSNNQNKSAGKNKVVVSWTMMIAAVF